LGRRQCNKQGHASAKGNAVASLAKGGKVVRKGGLATKKDYEKKKKKKKKKECSFANGVEGAKDGTLAIDGDLAKGEKLRRGGQGYHEENFAGDRCLPSPWQSTLLKLANIAKDGNCATKGNCAEGGVIAKDGKPCQGLQLHQGC
jgi:hypothetical protein